MAEALAASGQYRIQRRLRPRPKLDVPRGVELKQALFVVVETTGLDPIRRNSGLRAPAAPSGAPREQ